MDICNLQAICHICGAYPLINGVRAVLIPRFMQLVQDLNIPVMPFDKSSTLVCKCCVKIVTEFGVFMANARHFQTSIANYNLFQEQENNAKQEDDDIVIIEDNAPPIAEKPKVEEITQASARAPPTITISNKPRSLSTVATNPNFATVPSTTRIHTTKRSSLQTCQIPTTKYRKICPKPVLETENNGITLARKLRDSPNDRALSPSI